MTDSSQSTKGESKNDNDSRVKEAYKSLQTGSKPLRYRIHMFFHGIFKRKPAYMITKHGVEVHYFNFADTDTLPFDTETYKDTQIFIGNWANPWYVDIDSIKDAYPDFTEQSISTIEGVFTDDHVYPSQRWKLLANQNALRDMFVGGAIDDQRIMRLLYAACAGIGFIAILLLFGGA